MTVEPFGLNGAVVLFEAIPQKIAVKCTDKNQFEFVWSKTNKSKLDGTEFMSPSSRDGGRYDSIDLERNSGMQDSAWFKNAGYKVITFGRYLDDYNLRNEWVYYNKPKSLSPHELVNGKIYVAYQDDSIIVIFRYKQLLQILFEDVQVNCYSYVGLDADSFKINSWACCSSKNRICRNATPSEAQSLIRSEIEHGYFHELKDTK